LDAADIPFLSNCGGSAYLASHDKSKNDLGLRCYAQSLTAARKLSGLAAFINASTCKDKCKFKVPGQQHEAFISAEAVTRRSITQAI
jgi:hypothetical protein